jgi:bifunctional non-homologous end joining protein LigD
MKRVKSGPHVVELSNTERVLFPDDHITKGDLIRYYQKVSQTMLPHIMGRPLNMQRFPQGIDHEGFYQQEIGDYFPDWIDRVTVPKGLGGKLTHVLCNSEATLLYLANQACITPHVWLSRLGPGKELRNPDLMAFDLDPPDGGDFPAISSAARALRGLLEELGLTPYIKTTGSRGLHVVVPLEASADFDTVRSFSQNVAKALASRHPDEMTVEQRKNRRGTRIFIDTLRNSYGQTMVAPYAVRASPGAPVSTPLSWDELSNVQLHSQRYNIRNIFRRLGHKHDPWAEMHRHAAPLAASDAL